MALDMKIVLELRSEAPSCGLANQDNGFGTLKPLWVLAEESGLFQPSLPCLPYSDIDKNQYTILNKRSSAKACMRNFRVLKDIRDIYGD